MRILIANDDGIKSAGIAALTRVLSAEHDIIVVAPARQQSGMAHALTVGERMELCRIPALEAWAKEAWSINGTPTDCVKVYLEAMAGSQRPDLVLSGINHGSNLGTDVLYSGTVGAAMEGYLHRIMSIAVSLDIHAEISYEDTARIFAAMLPELMERKQSPSLLNVNFPAKLRPDHALAWTKLGNRDYKNAFKRCEESGHCYYTMAGEIDDQDNDDKTDIHAVADGYIAITPLQTDLTDYPSLEAAWMNR